MSDITGVTSGDRKELNRRSTPDITDDDSENYVPQSVVADEENDAEDKFAEGDSSSALRRLQTGNSLLDRQSQDILTRVLSEGLRSRRSSVKPITNIGGGRPMPPELPDRDAWRVDFDGPDDPVFPQNWPTRKKLVAAAILAGTSMTSAWGSSIYSPGIPMLMEYFHKGEAVVALGLSVYVFGFASGPIIWAPFSELRGRKEPLVIAMFMFTCFNFAVAVAKDFQTLIICRFFAGFCGAAPLAIVAASFADLYSNQYRGTAMAIYAATVFCGPLLAPVVGGFIANSYLGWRWLSYITGIMGGAITAALFFLLPEPYAPVILCRKAAELRRQTGNWGIYAPFEAIELEIGELLSKNFLRPIKLLFTEPILLLITIYATFVYGILYLCLDAYPAVFGPGNYNFKGGVVYLPYIGMAVGCLLSALCIVTVFEPYYVRAAKRNNGRPIPEMRLPAMILGSVIFPIGIFWLTWTGNYPQKVHWAVPAVSGIFIGFGLLSIFLPAINYIIDSYLMFAASAMAANTLMRSAFAGAFPLFGAQMFHNLGINWAGTLVGCLAAALAPVPVIFYIYGERIRMKSKFAQTLN